MQQVRHVHSASVIGLDIGGAHLKAADTSGNASAIEFALWARPQELSDRLYAVLKSFPQRGQVVATMTGELADCFLDRSVGVRHLVEHLCAATDRLHLPAPMFYSVDGVFYDAAEAIRRVDSVAASNWHALANFVAVKALPSHVDQALVVDVGSTTCDLIPVGKEAGVLLSSRTDFDRLREGSLVYLGGGRTPVCSIVDQLELSGEPVPIMREVFATMADVRRLLGHADDDPGNDSTADGKPADRFHSANRLARMIGLDHRHVGIDQATELAGQVHRAAQRRIAIAAEKLMRAERIDADTPIILSGHAEDLIDLLARDRQTYRLVDRIGVSDTKQAIGRCAPSLAVAVLYAEDFCRLGT